MTVCRTVYSWGGLRSFNLHFGLFVLLMCSLGEWQPAQAEVLMDSSQPHGPANSGISGTEEGTQPEPVIQDPSGPELTFVSGLNWDLSKTKIKHIALTDSLHDPVSVDPTSVESDKRYSSLGSRLGAGKWEAGAIFAYMTVTQIAVTKETQSFHFQDEGWFGKNTHNLGVDKLTHAFNSYLLAEFFQARIARKTGDARGAAVPAALLASGLMLYSELYDAYKVSSGFSYQDVVFNTAGAAFSALRNVVPGMKEKIDFRLMLIPNSDIYTFKGKRHYEQQRFLMSVELAGFDKFKDSPLRFLELQVGYRAKGFTNEDIAKGETPSRRIFYGVGLNIKEIFFKSSRSTAGKVAGRALDYVQIPYTAAHVY